MNRRDLLTGLAALALVPLSGCALLRSEGELDTLIRELESLIAILPAADRRDAQAIAEDIEETAAQLLRLHREFLATFNDSAADRSIAADALRQITVAYSEERVALRNRLLYLQDDLHRALPETTWAEASRILNDNSPALAPRTGRGS